MNNPLKISSLGISNICSAFGGSPIGSKVLGRVGFLSAVLEAIQTFDWDSTPVPGQAVIDVPAAVPYVSAGVGRPSRNPDDYVLREHRGRVSAYLKRERAVDVTSCRVVVYTLEGYKNDPQVTQDDVGHALGHSYMFGADGETFIIVAVLASGDEPSQRSPYRFVDCLAGGNNEADTWSLEDVKRMAKDIIDCDNRFDVVAG